MNDELRTMNYGNDNNTKKANTHSSVFSIHNSLLGFTLIELLVVVSIVGLLAGLLISNVSGIRERARDVQRKSDLYQIKQALKMYHNDFGTYPSSSADGEIMGCVDGGTACTWEEEFSVTGGNTYMKVLPTDPTLGNYFYKFVDTDNFTLYAVLENVSDKDIVSSQQRCSGSGASAYYVCAD